MSIEIRLLPFLAMISSSEIRLQLPGIHSRRMQQVVQFYEQRCQNNNYHVPSLLCTPYPDHGRRLYWEPLDFPDSIATSRGKTNVTKHFGLACNIWSTMAVFAANLAVSTQHDHAIDSDDAVFAVPRRSGSSSRHASAEPSLYW